jgi:hypothetical protein|uniref:Uncharacterized protein n=1 Tax=Ignisphaera aggregans TaxID=334771 RepID=A0A7J2U1V8_9CREN
MPSIGIELDNVMICLYTLDGTIEDECVSQALHSIYTISLYLGVRIRYSTLQSLANYVREWNTLTELEQELVAELFKDLVKSYIISDYNHVKEVSKKIFKILIGTGIDTKTAKDTIELALNTLYTALSMSLISTASEDKALLNTHGITVAPENLVL